MQWLHEHPLEPTAKTSGVTLAPFVRSMPARYVPSNQVYLKRVISRESGVVAFEVGLCQVAHGGLMGAQRGFN